MSNTTISIFLVGFDGFHTKTVHFGHFPIVLVELTDRPHADQGNDKKINSIE